MHYSHVILHLPPSPSLIPFLLHSLLLSHNNNIYLSIFPEIHPLSPFSLILSLSLSLILYGLSPPPRSLSLSLSLSLFLLTTHTQLCLVLVDLRAGEVVEV